jgi:hypothetical protein
MPPTELKIAREYVLAHEPDAAWIIALWLAIHGGDGGPEQAAAEAIAALAPYLRSAEFSFSAAQLKEGFAKLGVQVTERASEIEQAEKPGTQAVKDKAAKDKAKANDIDRPERPIHQYCFKFEGQTICVELPLLNHRRIAA